MALLLAVGAPERVGDSTSPLVRLDVTSLPGSLAPALSNSADRRSAAGQSNGVILLSWLDPGPAGSHTLRLSRLGPGGFEAPTTVIESDHMFANWADVPSVTTAPDGTMLAHFAEKSASDPYAYDVQLAILASGSRTFRRLGPAHDDRTASEHGFVSALPGGPGEFRLFWLDGRATSAKGGAMTLRTALVSNKGVSHGEVLDERVCDCCGTAATFTRLGPLVVYRDRSESEVRDISVSRQVADRWTAPKPVHEDGWKITGCPVNGPAVDARGDTVAAAWFTSATRPGIRVAFSQDSGATFGRPIVVDEALPHLEGRVGVVLDGDSAIVSWLGGREESISHLWVRRIHPSGARSQAIAILKTSSARASGFPRMARRGSELILAWTEVGPPTRVQAGKLPIDAIPDVGESALVEPTLPPVSAEEYGALTLEGRPITVSALRGQVVLLNLWATWCEPCRAEEPELAKLRRVYGARGLTVVGVSMDEARAIDALRAHARKSAAFDATWHDPEAKGMSRFRVPALPASFVLDRTGEIVWSKLGAVSEKDAALRRAIEAALAP